MIDFATMFNDRILIMSIVYYLKIDIAEVVSIILCLVFGIYKVEITNKNYYTIRTAIEYNSSTILSDDKIGLVVSYKYMFIGYISKVVENDIPTYKGYIFIRKNDCNVLMQVPQFNVNDHMVDFGQLIEIGENRYKITKLTFPKFKLINIKHQHMVASYIYKKYNSKDVKNVVAVLYGKPNQGKSMTAHYLANIIVERQSVMLVNYNLDTKSITFSDFIFESKRLSDASIIIILIDEIDIAITKMHERSHMKASNENISNDKYILKTKYEYNDMMDKINLGVYDRTIIIMTTNKDRQYFNNLDESYLRYGRVDMHINYDDLDIVMPTMTKNDKLYDYII